MKFSSSDYRYATSNHQGICLACWELNYEVEPDAHNYECEYCGQPMVMGMEDALLEGHIEITDGSASWQ